MMLSTEPPGHGTARDAENLFPAARGKKSYYIRPASRIFAFSDSRS